MSRKNYFKTITLKFCNDFLNKFHKLKSKNIQILIKSSVVIFIISCAYALVRFAGR
jgi:hypothetical protein